MTDHHHEPTALAQTTGEQHRNTSSSPARITANRRNALKSTGPRSIDGKERSSRNATKHGLCSMSPIIAGECQATYNIFRAELETELRPRTPIQWMLLPHIANLLWRLQRVPHVERRLLEIEMARPIESVDETPQKDEELAPLYMLAQRFSDDRINGLLMLARYERGMQNLLMRLLGQFEHLRKRHNATAAQGDPDEPPVPRERAYRPPNFAETIRARIEANRSHEDEVEIEDSESKTHFQLPHPQDRPCETNPPAKMTGDQ